MYKIDIWDNLVKGVIISGPNNKKWIVSHLAGSKSTIEVIPNKGKDKNPFKGSKTPLIWYI